MTLDNSQLDRLTDSIVEHMLSDKKFMRDVAREQAEAWSLKEYNEWFGELSDREEENDK